MSRIIGRISIAIILVFIGLPAGAAVVNGLGLTVFFPSVSVYLPGSVPAVMNFTSYDGQTDISPLREVITGGYLYSGELRPRKGGSGIYEMDFITVKTSDGSIAYYGSLEINLPVTDTDANGLPDFAQQNMPCSISTTGVAITDFSSIPQFPAGSRNVLITMSRNSGSQSGTYTVVDQSTGGNIIHFSGIWEITSFSGSMVYKRGSQNLASLSINRSNSSGAVWNLNGSTVFTVDSENQLTFPQFQITNSTDGAVYTIAGTTYTRSGNKYSGSITFTDGDIRTAWNDQTSWRFEIIDSNDIDGNGVPDLSDSTYATTELANRVLYLDGSNGYVSVANSPSLHSADQITIEAWIYPESTQSNQSQYFISKGDGKSISSDRSYHINWKPPTAASPGFNVEMFFNQNNYAFVIVPAIEKKWIHVALTFNSVEGVMKFYTNGTLASQQTKDSANGSLQGQTIRQSTQNLVFGNLLTPPALGGYAKGCLDEVRIWNIAREPVSIVRSMQSRVSNLDSNLIAYWKFDDGDLTDASGNGHNGQISGNASLDLISGNDDVHAARIKSIAYQTNGLSLININLSTNQPHVVWSSSNLLNWTIETNFIATNSPIDVSISSATNSQNRFYRLTSP